MKKTYLAPRVEVNEISATQMICESIQRAGEYTGSQTLLGRERDRGDYEPANDKDNFGDLW